MLMNKIDKDIVESNVFISIEKQCLTDEQLTLSYRRKWFKLWVPKELGGEELTLIEGVRFLENLAYLDGSLGWTVTLCAGANLFVGFIDREKGDEVFKDERVCLGGSGMLNGQATIVEGGYLVSGQWRYATGALHLTHFTANVQVFDANGPLVDGVDNPVYITIFVDSKEVHIIKDWCTFGLESTASHSFMMDNVFVPQNQIYSLRPDCATRKEILYQYPFMPFAEVTLLANYMGMFSRFLDLVTNIFHKKASSAKWQATYGDYLMQLSSGVMTDFQKMREEVYTDIALSWDNLLKGVDNKDVYTRIAKNSRRMVSFIKNKVIALYPFCGIMAAQRDHILNIVFRNLFTATQHSLLLAEDSDE